ncbi:MAG: hypothetical protein ACPGXK_11145 [Phycisphaerae bacterium]
MQFDTIALSATLGQGDIGDWVESLFVLVIILLGAFQQLASWLINRARGKADDTTVPPPPGEQPQRTGTPLPRAPQKRSQADDDIPWLEVLTEDEPPKRSAPPSKPPVRRPPPPRRRPPAQQPPQQPTASPKPKAIPVAKPVSKQPRQRYAEPPQTHDPAQSTKFVEHIDDAAYEKPAASKRRRVKMTSRQLRQAIVWSEILAPPIALRDEKPD